MKKTKKQTPWERLVNFAYTYELTPGNFRKSLKSKRKLNKKVKKTPGMKFTSERRRIFWAAAGLLLMLTVFMLKDVPSPAKLATGDFPVSTQIFDRNGELLYEIYAEQNRTPIKLADLPEEVKLATIAVEDKNFYHHIGIDITGVTRAAYKTLSGQRLEGGSTITQQLVKVTLLTPKRTMSRKIREALLALVTEIIYTKNEILEMYLNHAPYGGTAYGIEQAAKLYFNKHARDLTAAEAALLAGLPQAPTRYSPFGSRPENAKSRQKEVLRRMREDGYITTSQEQEIANQPLVFGKPDVPIRAPHFVLWIKDMLIEEYGVTKVERGGLRVTTTLDINIQEQAQASVSAEVKRLERMRVGNGAALVTNPQMGEILAMVGSRDYFDNEHDGNVNVTLRPRQPGSSIKPLMYTTGFSTGKLTPSTMWLDVPSCFSVPGQPLYCPRNYDNAFHGPVQVRFALGDSYNLPAVKSLAYIGVKEMIATVSAMGIETFTDPSKYGLSLTLGGGEVTMIDMATAFGVLANNGVKMPLAPILKVEDWRGKVLFEYSREDREQDRLYADQEEASENKNEKKGQLNRVRPARVIPAPAAYLVSHILLDNNARTAAFGPNSELVIKGQVVSAKTGTTNDLKDNWTIGYTPDRLAAVWVGNNDGSPMHPYLVSGITGAAPIWHDIMSRVLEGREPVWPRKPEGVVGRDVCATTGLLPNPEAPCGTRHEFFWEEYLPAVSYPAEREIWIRKDTGLPPDPDIPLDQQGEIELQMHTVLSDPLTPEFCADCPWPAETDPETGEIKSIQYPGATIRVIAP